VIFDKKPRPPIYGIVAEFDSPALLMAAVRNARQEGYSKMDAYTPFPVEELAEELGFKGTRLPLLILAGGLLGCFGGYMLQYWSMNIAYPLNVAGRPFHSWPLFIPITFETTVLTAAIFAVFGMLGLNGLPMPYHPLFNVPNFALASNDKFFLCIEATDPRFSRDITRLFLESLNPRSVAEVPH